MSLEIHSADFAKFSALWKAWEGAPTNAEIEATFKTLDYTTFLNVMKHLRGLGLAEEPQETKLNIMVPGGLRFTLVGEKVISAYCKDNTLKGKPFHVIKKEKKLATAGGLTEVDLNEYDVRIKLRRELPMDPMNHQVAEALANWARLPKSFRYIKRYQFKSTTHAGIVFDASLVRSSRKDARGAYIPATNFLDSGLLRVPIQYEMEVEALAGAKAMSMLVGIMTVLRGIQGCYDVVRNSVRAELLTLLSRQTGARPGTFPGPQPVTLHRENIALEAEAGVPNLRHSDYNVTDKADGLRCLLIAAEDGRLYMVDRNLKVYGTGRRLSEADVATWRGAVLDGEWVTHDATDKPMSRYYAFDIYNGARGEDVTGRPFLIRTEGAAVSRLAAMNAAVAAFEASNHTIPKIPAEAKFSIHVKTFKTPASAEPGVGIFQEAGGILERLSAGAPYHTDGLIFTPNDAPLPKNMNTWAQQFKWKPASMNSVDFLVSIEKVGDLEGKPTAIENISTLLNEETNQIVRCKTLRLYVGSSMHPVLEKPRETILQELALPRPTELNADYRHVEFSPQPPDPKASTCHVAINAGATDPAGAAPEARAHAALDENIYCENGDPIENHTIVEMAYDPLKPAGFRWKPLRVRWDKTAQFASGRIAGTLNNERVANDVWTSIHDPVTEQMIRTGAVTEVEPVGGVGVPSEAIVAGGAYYQRKASQQDLYKVRGLTEFHNQYIKQMLLSRALRKKGSALIDMSAGRAGDLHRWIRAGVSWVLGCDIDGTGLNENTNGAYRRYLDQLIKARTPVPQMIFVQADSTKRYADGAAGSTPEDRIILRTLWGEPEPAAPPAAKRLGGRAALGFDAAALMFTLHYMFESRDTLDGLLRNLSETVKVGGMFVGCCFDGDAVASLLADVPLNGTKRGTENGTEIWSITKRYDDATGTVPPTETGLGMAIDVNFISIGETHKEYLVSYPYFEARMAEIGFEPLNATELKELGLVKSSNLFRESHAMATTNGYNYPMSPVVQTFSFLNRWFMFVRRRATGFVAPAMPRLTAAVTPEPSVADFGVPETKEDEAAPVFPTVAPVAEEPPAAIPVAFQEEEDAAVPAAVAAEEPAGGAGNAGVAVATGPIFAFYQKSAKATNAELKTLGLRHPHWRRYLSTYAPFEFMDLRNPAIRYPNLEAAMGAAKYQLASNKPEKGAEIFSTEGLVHRIIMNKRATLEQGLTGGAAAKKRELTQKEVDDLIEDEGDEMKKAAKPTEMKKAGAKFDAAAWDAVKERVLVDYVRQRAERDAVFNEILAALRTQNARLVFSGGATNELAGVVKDGAIEGSNLYGRALMRQIGLTY